jgi:hypothetical protein
VKCLDTLSLHWLTTPLSDLLSLHQIYALIWQTAPRWTLTRCKPRGLMKIPPTRYGRQAWYYQACKIVQWRGISIDVILDCLSASLYIQFIVAKYIVYNCNITSLSRVRIFPLLWSRPRLRVW